MTERPSVDTLCHFGCSWDCEHRASEAPERARLRAVEDSETGRSLRRCRDCGDYFYDAVIHGREHAHMRQLGWLSRADSWR